MFKHFFKVSLRNLIQHKTLSTIKIAGLAVGIAFFLLLISYVRDELRYDRFHDRADRIFLTTSSIGRQELTGISNPFLGELLKAEFPEVRRAARFWRIRAHVKSGDQIVARNVALADPDLLEIFTFPFVRGAGASLLGDPARVILSSEEAALRFGGVDPVGQVLSIRLGSETKDFTVAGVLRRIPGNSSLKFDMLISFRNYPLVFGEEFQNSIVAAPFFHNTFLELADTRHAAGLSAKFPAFLQKSYGGEYAKFELAPDLIRLGLYPLTAYHLGAVPAGDLEPRSRRANSYILLGIALAVLFLAAFNHVNLSIAQSAGRAMEIGVRKVTGAGRGQIARFFLADSALLCLIAAGFGTVIASGLVEAFNGLTGKSLSLEYLARGPNLLVLPLFAAAVGLSAGAYPAFFLSRLEPAGIFRRQVGLGGRGLMTRGLVVLQFAVSAFLTIGTLVMSGQLRFMLSKDLGFDPRNVIAVPTYAFWTGENSGAGVLASYKDLLRTAPQVMSVTGASATVGDLGFGGAYPLLRDGREIPVEVRTVDPDFLPTLGVPVLRGRNFSRESQADVAEAVIVNEAFVRLFGLGEPVGKRFSEFSGDPRPQGFRYNPVIIGVARDFHFSSLRREVGPLVLNLKSEPLTHVLVKHAPGQGGVALGLLKKVWSERNPELPFTYQFLEDVIGRQYKNDRDWTRIVGYATAFAIGIASLGLFGLAGLAAARRTKEIGIRKVLGASLCNIALLLSGEFLALVAVAQVLAWPPAYYAARRWLEGFAFRTGPGPWTFVAAAAIALSVAVLTLAFHSFKSALSNPKDSLRYE